MSILNQYQITENICSSGQPTKEQFGEIASAGYECVINLAMPDHEKSIADEASVVTSYGMTYIHIPVPINAPTKEHLEEFSGYMDVLKDKKVWVHCIVNARVSAFLFCYLQRNRGMPPKESTTPVLEEWLPRMDETWKAFIDQASSKPIENVTETHPGVENDGTLHVAEFVLPPSSYLSRESRHILAPNGMDPWGMHGVRDLPDACLKLKRSKADLSPEEYIVQLRLCYDEIAKVLLQKTQTIYSVDVQSQKMAEFCTYTVTPKEGISDRNRNRVIVYLPGSGFLLNTNLLAQSGAIPIAALGNVKVIGVDYRKAPEHTYPAAIEDLVTLYKSLLQEYRPENIGIYGCSAGGSTTAMSVPWFKREGLPPAGALVMSGNGASEFTFGDSMHLTAGLSNNSFPKIGSTLPEVHPYFKNSSTKDPYVFPAVSSDVLREFPPSLLMSSTRDYSLSNAVYTHTQLVKQGVKADLHVWEGLPHCFQEYYPDLPETHEAYEVLLRFFDKHLGMENIAF